MTTEARVAAPPPLPRAPPARPNDWARGPPDLAGDWLKPQELAGEFSTSQEVISKLRFIAALKPGERIDTTTLTVHPDTYFNRIYRAFVARGESRQATLDFVRNTIDNAMGLSAAYENRPEALNQKIKSMLHDALAGSKVGLRSLCDTYSDDRMFVSRVETLIATLEAKLDNMVKP